MDKKEEKDISQQLAELKEKFSGLLSRKKRAMIGVDVGSRSVKVVELEGKKGKIHLKNYAFARTEKKLLKIGVSGIINNIAGEMTVRTLEEADIKNKNINVAVPGFTSLITTIEVPDVSDNEIDRVIREEVPKYIPLKLSEVVYGWQIVGEGKEVAVPSSVTGGKKKEKIRNKGTKRVLVVAIMKEISDQYQKVFIQQGLEVDSLEIDSFSLVRSLIGNAKGNYLILDIGHKVTNIIVVSNSNAVASRTVDVAGERINQVIKNGMKVDDRKAEQLKLQYGVNLGSNQDQKLLAPTLGLVITEAKKTIDLIKQDYPELAIDRVILSGGTARMSGFREYIEKGLGVPTIIGNPLSKVVYPKKLERILMNYSPFLAVSVGLAMLGFEEKEILSNSKNINKK